MTWGGGGGQPPGNPWSDPGTPTVPGTPYAGAPYAGPPPTAPPQWGPPAYGYPQPYAAAPWGPPYGYPLPPRPPQRPGQVITAAVLAFAQSVVVLIASVYVWFFASIADVATAAADGVYDPTTVGALAAEGAVLAIVQIVSVVLLIGAGVWALNSRSRRAGLLLSVALAVQVVLAAYWLVRLQSEIGGFDTDGTLVAIALFFATAPLVGLGMLLVGPGRRWFDGTDTTVRQP